MRMYLAVTPAGWVPAVAVAEAQAPVPGDPRGEAMVAELKWVHDMIRRDLRTVRQMAADAAAGPGGRGDPGWHQVASGQRPAVGS